MILRSATHLGRPRPLAFVLSLLVVVAALAALTVALRRGPIEKDLAARAAAAVHRFGTPRVQATATGTVVTLHGDFPSSQAAQAALRAAKVRGVTSTRLGPDALVATMPAQPVVLAVAAGGLTVSATVPDSAARTALLGQVDEAGDGRTTSRITLDPRVAEPPLPSPAALAGLVAALARAPGTHTLTLDGSLLVLAGTVADEGGRTGLGAAVLTAARGDVRLRVDNRLVVPASSARAALAAATGGRSFTFGLDSDTLSPADEANLAVVAGALRDGALPVVVAGHTDSTGSVAFNDALALRRARAAAAYLESLGVPADRVRAVGYGSSRPAADNDTAAGRAANRRVEITPASAS
jgi:OOP family OmpA-OmpF porin